MSQSNAYAEPPEYGGSARSRHDPDRLSTQQFDRLAGFIHVGMPTKRSEDRPRPALRDIVTRF